MDREKVERDERSETRNRKSEARSQKPELRVSCVARAFVRFRGNPITTELAAKRRKARKRQTVPNPFPNESQVFPFVPKCSQAIPRPFPNDSEIVPILCLIDSALNTWLFPRNSEDRKGRKNSARKSTAGLIRLRTQDSSLKNKDLSRLRCRGAQKTQRTDS